tara:strand:- start:42 stop:341 length:300 start_codon:yes stop_codon:yes gene_type:complete
MSKPKKVTYKELMERNDFLLGKCMEIERTVNYTHTLLLAYIDCNEDQDKLKQFLEEVNKDGQSDGSNTEGNRKNKSGNTDTKSKSSKAGVIPIKQEAKG